MTCGIARLNQVNTPSILLQKERNLTANYWLAAACCSAAGYHLTSFVALGQSIDDDFSAERFWSSAWVWIPGLALCAALGWAGFQRSPGAVLRRVLPGVFAVAGSVAMVVTAEAAPLGDDGIPGFLIAVTPPAALAAVSVAWLRASPYWAICIVAAASLAGGVYAASAQGRLDSPAVMIAGLTSLLTFMFTGSVTVVLLAILAPTGALVRAGWHRFGC